MSKVFNDYAGAAAYLSKGKSKNTRRISPNKYVARIDDERIALVLHQTAVVVYFADGRTQLQSGGWQTVTTNRTIRNYSRFHVSSDKGRWFTGYTDEVTAPRVQKCRTCKGEGGSVERRVCYGPSHWEDNNRCSGPTVEYRVPFTPGNFDDHFGSRYIVPCAHGPAFTTSHRTSLCKHGQRNQHKYGEVQAHPCYRCNGAGVFDYGSKRVPQYWVSERILLDADGKAIADAEYISAPKLPYHTPDYYSKPYFGYKVPEPQVNKGDDIVAALKQAIPGVTANVKCPHCDITGPIHDAIVHLNDVAEWSREEVADWLESLDADLSFPIPA